MDNVISWFEIPVTDFERAVKFYGTIFDVQLARMGGEGHSLAIFPHNGEVEGGGVGGALVAAEGYVPSAIGPLVYLNANPDLNVVLERVERAGGQQVKAKTDIGDDGFYAIIIDTEGNRVGLISTKGMNGFPLCNLLSTLFLLCVS